MFFGTRQLLINQSNVEVIRHVPEDGTIEVVTVSGRTYYFKDPTIIRKALRPSRSRIVRFLCWLLGV